MAFVWCVFIFNPNDGAEGCGNRGSYRESNRRKQRDAYRRRANWYDHNRYQNWRRPSGTTGRPFHRPEDRLHHPIKWINIQMKSRVWEEENVCEITSQASLPSAPAQMDVGGRMKLGPNWVLSAAWHLASSHKGTSISLRMTECVPSSSLRPQPVTTHRVPSASDTWPGCGIQATSICGRRLAGRTNRNKAMSLANDKLLNCGWTTTWDTSSSSYGSCSVVTETSYSPNRTFNVELTFPLAKLSEKERKKEKERKVIKIIFFSLFPFPGDILIINEQ